jgi:hypothetical protein
MNLSLRCGDVTIAGEGLQNLGLYARHSRQRERGGRDIPGYLISLQFYNICTRHTLKRNHVLNYIKGSLLFPA